MNENELIRIQDKDGRGPWRPNFSKIWLDKAGPDLGLPVYEDFENFNCIIKKAHSQGKYLGCAMREENLSLWFTKNEIRKLKKLGFDFVSCRNVEILAENKRQAIIASKLPLKFLPYFKKGQKDE